MLGQRKNGVAARIRSRIEGIPEGEPFVTSAFLELGSRAAVDQALSRLVKAGEIERVSRGIYVRPRQSHFVGKVPPAPLQVARAVAKASGSHLQVHGAEAARRLGLTTQVPTRPVFLTSGPSRRFWIGKLEVNLKHASPRKFVLAGRPAGEALAALWHLGKQGVNEWTVEQLRSRLPAAEFEALVSARASMPAWMARSILMGSSRGANIP